MTLVNFSKEVATIVGEESAASIKMLCEEMIERVTFGGGSVCNQWSHNTLVATPMYDEDDNISSVDLNLTDDEEEDPMYEVVLHLNVEV